MGTANRRKMELRELNLIIILPTVIKHVDIIILTGYCESFLFQKTKKLLKG